MCGCGLLPWLPLRGRSLKEDALGSRTGILIGSTLTFVRDVCRFGASVLSGFPSNASFRSEGVVAKALTGGGNSCGESVSLGRGDIWIVDS